MKAVDTDSLLTVMSRDKKKNKNNNNKNGKTNKKNTNNKSTNKHYYRLVPT